MHNEWMPSDAQFAEPLDELEKELRKLRRKLPGVFWR